MAKKDFTVAEDQEYPGKNHQQDNSEEKKSEKDLPSSEIKNAHATGDGSFGRNDESIPDKDENEKKGNVPY